jgi:hypothetical protein
MRRLFLAAALLAAPAAEAASVREIFEAHSLPGTFAFDRARPVGRSRLRAGRGAPARR